MKHSLFALAAENFEAPVEVAETGAESTASDLPVTAAEEVPLVPADPVPLEEAAQLDDELAESSQDISQGNVLANAMDSIGETIEGTLEEGGEGLTPEEAQTVGTAMEALRLVAGFQPGQVMNVSFESFGAPTRKQATLALAQEAEESAGGIRASIAKAGEKLREGVGKLFEKLKLKKSEGEQQEAQMKNFWGKRQANASKVPALPEQFTSPQLAQMLEHNGKILAPKEYTALVHSFADDFKRWMEGEVSKQDKTLAQMLSLKDKDGMGTLAVQFSASYADNKSKHDFEVGDAVFYAYTKDSAEKYYPGLFYVTAQMLKLRFKGGSDETFKMPDAEEVQALFEARRYLLDHCVKPSVDRFNAYQKKFGVAVNAEYEQGEVHEVRKALLTSLYEVNGAQVNSIRHMLMVADALGHWAIAPLKKP